MTQKIAVLEKGPTPYRPVIFEELGKTAEIDVWYAISDNSNQRWDDSELPEGRAFDEYKMATISFGPLKFAPLLPLRIIRGDYDTIVTSVSYANILNSMILIPIISVTDSKHIVWTENIETEWEPRKNNPLYTQLLARVLRKVTSMLNLLLYQSADQIAAFSELASEYAQKEGAPSERIKIAPQAISQSSDQKKDINSDFPETGYTVLFLGSLSKRKGVDTLLCAIEYLPDSYKVVFAGEGPLSGEVEKSAKESDQIDYYGWVSPEDKSKLISEASLLVLPSRHEPWGIVVNEALEAGTPAVTTAMAGAKMILPDSAVCNPNDPQGLAETIMQCAGTKAPTPPVAEEMAQVLK